MHLIGRKGHKSEAYPTKWGGSPGAAQPFVVLGLSEDAPFIDGTPLVIPFDTVVYQSSAFGGFETEAGSELFFLPFGVYLATLQIIIDTEPTTLDAILQIGSGSAGDAGDGQTNGVSGAAVTISAARLGSETPIPAHVLPVATVPRVLVTGGGNGNVLAVLGDSGATKLFIWKLVEFQPIIIT